jgi:hypothetical protein
MLSINYAESRKKSIALSVIILNAVMLNVNMLIAIIMSVVASEIQ